MDTHGQKPADHRSATASPNQGEKPRTRQNTPGDNDLAHALLSLSLPSETATPVIDRPRTSQLPGSYPDTPAHPRQIARTQIPNDPFHTPIRDPESSQSLQYPNLTGFESSPERDRSESPTPGAPRPKVSSPAGLPEPSDVRESKTLVILHDACTKHKFSRNVTTRERATIVERPERCRASILGIAAAKCRLETETWNDLTFEISKSDRLGELSDEAVIDVHGNKWPSDLTLLCSSAAEKISRGDLEIPRGYHSGDLYLCEGSHEALRGCIGSVYDGVDRVLAGGYDRVHVSVRPPGHHCAEAVPSGFCMINNVHIAIAYAHRKYGVTRAAILDFDLHHGDGSQAIAWSINEKTNQLQASRPSSHPSVAPGVRIGYFSLHDINSFPCEEGVAEKVQEASLCLSAHGQSIWNIHLRHHANDALFDEIYELEYSIIFKRAGEFLGKAEPNETCMVFLSAGFDASEHETKGMQRHGYNLPTRFYQRFACDAIALANRYASGKILSVLEGGYADRAIISGSFAFMVGLSGVPEKSVDHESREWWSVPRLALLEKYAKKIPSQAKANHPGADDDIRWASETVTLAAQLSPAFFVPNDSATDPALLTTPRVGLRERKKPTMPSTAPPSAVKKRQQRVTTPKARKFIPATETLGQDSDAPPVPSTVNREASPGAGLSKLMESMSIANGTHGHIDTKFRDLDGSAPGTPTPTGKGANGDSIH